MPSPYSPCARVAGWRLFAVLVAAGMVACGGQPETIDGGPPAVRALAHAKAEWPQLAIDVIEVTRAGGSVLVRLRFANAAAQPFDFGSRFAADPAERNSIADVALLDPAGPRKYFVLHDRLNRPACSTDLSPLQPGEARMLFARFPAPPADARITIQIPHAADVRDVPVGR